MRRYQRRAVISFAGAVFGVALMVLPSVAGSFENRTPSGQGWFWDRPATQVENVGDPFAQNVNNVFAGDHLYVGWDAADPDPDKREMISGVAFDLFIAGVPAGATITQFKVRLLEHTTSADPRTSHNNVNPGQAQKQGILACPWGDFFAGNAADPMTAAPKGGGECGAAAVAGVRGAQPVNPDALPSDQLYPWDFDLTDMMSELWSNDQMTAFSLEPNKFADAANKNQSWTISFHSGAYAEPQDATNPNGPQNPKPGVLAQISWAPPPESIGGGDFDFGGSVDFGDTGSTDSGFDLGQPPPPEAPTAGETTAAPRQLFQGAVEGRSAPFWSIGFGRWLLAALLGLAIAAAGWMLTADPVTEGRPPGAINALINGRTDASKER